MSHWKSFTNNTLKDTNMGFLTMALKEMGLGLDHNTKEVRNAYGRETVDMALTSDKKGVLSLGFKLNADKVLELKGDFWATGLNEAKFIDSLSQKYQQMRITDAMENAGWNVEANQVGDNIELELTQW